MQRIGLSMRAKRKVKENSKLTYDVAVYLSRQSGQLIKNSHRYRLIDLFAGAGGLTLGFTKEFGHPFEPVWANDFDDASVVTYITNFGNHCVRADILDVVSDPNVHIPPAIRVEQTSRHPAKTH